MLFIGDYLIKYAVKSQHTVLFLCMAAFIWAMSVPGWYYLNITERLAIIGMLFSVLSLIIVPLIGMVCFNEQLSCKEWVGLGLAIISTLLLTNKI